MIITTAATAAKMIQIAFFIVHFSLIFSSFTVDHKPLPPAAGVGVAGQPRRSSCQLSGFFTSQERWFESQSAEMLPGLSTNISSELLIFISRCRILSIEM